MAWYLILLFIILYFLFGGIISVIFCKISGKEEEVMPFAPLIACFWPVIIISLIIVIIIWLPFKVFKVL